MAVATPGRCGLYETTRDLVAAERALGIDARIVDPKPHPTLHPGKEDRGVPLAPMSWAVEADLIVSHSGHDGTPVSLTDQPIVIVAHGRPVSTFIGEREGGAAAYTYHAQRSRQDRYKACITLWPEYRPYFESLWGGKPVHVVPPTVDLDYWRPGDSDYDFAKKGGTFDVVMTDPWSRRDVSPLPTIHAFDLFRRDEPGARLHIFAHDGNAKGLAGIRAMLGESLGLVQGWAADLRRVYRAADMLITPHRIYTRAIREAMACGVTVTSGMHAPAEDLERFANAIAGRMKRRPAWNREQAEDRFDPEAAGLAMGEIIQTYARVKVVA